MSRDLLSFGLPDSPGMPSLYTLKARQHMLTCCPGVFISCQGRLETTSGIAHRDDRGCSIRLLV